MPADGTRAATVGNGDFGTSPIFGQLSDKPLLASIWLCGVSDVNNNGVSTNYVLVRFDDDVVRQCGQFDGDHHSGFPSFQHVNDIAHFPGGVFPSNVSAALPRATCSKITFEWSI